MTERSFDALKQQAFLYVCGELDAAAASEFEDLLANDQDAREAVVETMSCLFAGRTPSPGKAYREITRRRLTRIRTRRFQGRRRRMVWALAGAAAASVVFVLLGLGGWLRIGAPAEQSAALPSSHAPSNVPNAEVIYSDLSSIDRVARVRDAQALRRQRNDDVRGYYPFTETVPAAPMRRGVSM